MDSGVGWREPARSVVAPMPRLARRRPLSWSSRLPLLVVGLVSGSEASVLPGPGAATLWGVILLLTPAALLAHRRAGAAMLLFAAAAVLGHVRVSSSPRVEGWPALQLQRSVHVEGVVESVRAGGPGREDRWTGLEIRLSGVAGEAGGPGEGDGLRLSIGESRRPWEIGDRVVGRLRLRRVRGFCNAGRDRYARWLASRGVRWTAWLRDDDRLEQASGLPGRPFWIDRARGAIGATIDRSVAGPAGGILRALVIGDKGRVAPDLREAFARTGSSHLLAVSGMHLSLVAGAVLLLVRRAVAAARVVVVPLDRIAAPIALAAALGYVALTGGAVATQRAALMLAIVVAGFVLGRAAGPLRCLLAAVGVLVLLDASVLRDLSFQLSAVSVAAIVALHARLGSTSFGRWLRGAASGRPHARIGAWLVGGALVSLAAGVTTAPLGAHYFGLVSLLGVPANLVLGPLLGMGALGVGLVGALLVGLEPSLAGVVFSGAGALVELACAFARFAAAWPFAAIPASLPDPRIVGACIASVGGALLPGRQARLGAALAAALLVACSFGRAPAEGLRVSFLDVGQGDAAVIEGGGRAWVLDGGGLGGSFDTGKGVVLPALLAAGARSPVAVALSHADRDHYGGLRAVVEKATPRELWWNGRPSDSSSFAALLAAVDDAGLRPRVLMAGDAPGRESAPGWKVLHPGARSSTLSENDASLVLAARYGATRVLFGGDVERRGERAMVASGRDLGATVLKVPHHASRSSSGSRFLAAVRPALAVASLGSFNRFGFPAPEVVARLRGRGSHFLATGGAGEVVVRSDGQLEQVATCRPVAGIGSRP